MAAGINPITQACQAPVGGFPHSFLSPTTVRQGEGLCSVLEESLSPSFPPPPVAMGVGLCGLPSPRGGPFPLLLPRHCRVGKRALCQAVGPQSEGLFPLLLFLLLSQGGEGVLCASPPWPSLAPPCSCLGWGWPWGWGQPRQLQLSYSCSLYPSWAGPGSSSQQHGGVKGEESLSALNRVLLPTWGGGENEGGAGGRIILWGRAVWHKATLPAWWGRSRGKCPPLGFGSLAESSLSPHGDRGRGKGAGVPL